MKSKWKLKFPSVCMGGVGGATHLCAARSHVSGTIERPHRGTGISLRGCVDCAVAAVRAAAVRSRTAHVDGVSTSSSELFESRYDIYACPC
jgi:hypothetical protein